MTTVNYIIIPDNFELSKFNEKCEESIWKTYDLKQNYNTYRLNKCDNLFYLEKYEQNKWTKIHLCITFTIHIVIHNRIYKYKLYIKNGILQNHELENTFVV